MFSEIKIHGRVTNNHEYFWFSRHFPPASKQISKSDLYLIALPSSRENHEKPQKLFFENFCGFFITLDKIRMLGVFLML